MTIQDVSRLLSSTRWQLETVNSTYTNIMLVAMDLLTNVTMSQTEVDNAQQVNCQTLILVSYLLISLTQPHFFLPPLSPSLLSLSFPPSLPHTFQMFNDADSALDSANLTALAALQATTQRSTILTNINQSASANAVQLAALNTSIDTLMAQLQEAMQAAASVSLHFASTIYVQYLILIPHPLTSSLLPQLSLPSLFSPSSLPPPLPPSTPFSPLPLPPLDRCGLEILWKLQFGLSCACASRRRLHNYLARLSAL